MYLKVNEVHQGDAKKLLKKIKPGSIALSVWSPPYFVGKSYEQNLSYKDWRKLLTTVVKLHGSILKPGGFLAINIADILAFADKKIPRFQALNISRQKCSLTKEDVLKAKRKHPHYNRYQLAELLGCSEQTVDRRLNGNNIRGGKYSIQTRVHLVGGMLEEAAYEAGLYLYDRRIWRKDPAWQNCKWHSLSYRSIDEFEYLYFFLKPGITKIDRRKLTKNEWKTWGSRGVWEFPSVRVNDIHEAMFPVELPRRVIKLLTFPKDVILDCFLGSGTTAVAAIQEGRNFIGIELMPKSVKIARKRIAEVQSQLKLI